MCSCHDIAMLSPCCCNVFAMVCYAIAMLLPWCIAMLYRHIRLPSVIAMFIAMLLPCYCAVLCYG